MAKNALRDSVISISPLRWEQPRPCFYSVEACNLDELVTRFFPGDESDVAAVDAQFFRDEFQQCLVCLSFHGGRGDLDFHRVTVFADHLVALRIRDDAKLQPARAQGFT